MNNRVGGLLIVSVALVFLWLYDTGRWTAIGAAINGTSTAGGLPSSVQGGINDITGALGLGSLFGGSNNSSTGAAGGNQGASYATQLFCNEWPNACPFDANTAPKSGGSSGGGSNTLGDIASIGATIASIFAL